MKIYHAAMPCCEPQVSPDVTIIGKASALVMPWLDQVLASGDRQPLEIPDVSHFSASAEERNDALLVTLWRPLAACRPGLPYRGKTEMFSAFGVAADQAGGEIFWTSLRTAPVPRAPQQPTTFWNPGLPRYTGSMARPEALGWLPDLQSAIAASWLRRTTASPAGTVVRIRFS